MKDYEEEEHLSISFEENTKGEDEGSLSAASNSQPIVKLA